ncbi:hypothetical protein KIS1582_4194 [Cytobacillus firmus]|uniref:Uncharacterized protein n=1 Tax=Cytobacillus firmus TaxID=1399 RepID=A0A800MT89_CYTFI|nr:hypothetical protein KIS1582_4194 [Cytobacillus firmus]
MPGFYISAFFAIFSHVKMIFPVKNCPKQGTESFSQKE